ncbi:MAG TPA: VC0807 family protein [Candidatus Elarobacter sp.]
MTKPAPARFRALYRSLAINVAIPLIVAQVLLHQGRPAVVALAIAAIFPFLDGVVSALRRRIDLLGVMSLIALVLGIALSFATGSAVFAIAKESLFTGAFGLAFLVSLAFPHPLIFSFAKQWAPGEEAAAELDAVWERPAARRVFRTMTIVWGTALLVEAALRVVVAFTFTPAVAITVSPILGIATIGLLIVWTTSYVRRARARAAAAVAAAAA